MTSAATANILFFIALSLGPRGTPGEIFATSNSDNYVWMHSSEGWSVERKGLPADEWMQQEEQTGSNARQEREFWVIAHHRWDKKSVLDLEDGSQVLKQKNAIFYIQDPGASNQKVFTILYPAADE